MKTIDSKKKTLKIAISLLSGISYGGVTYFKNLIPSLMACDTRNEYHLFLPPGTLYDSFPRQDNFITHTGNKMYKSAIGRFFWEQCLLPSYLEKNKIDLLYTAKNINVLKAKCKTVIAIRNMEPIKFDKYHNHWLLNIKNRLKYFLTKMSIRKADLVVAVSDYVRKTVQDHLSVAQKSKISVVYNGNPIRGKENINELSYLNGDILLTTSKFVAYANQLSLVKAWGAYCRENSDAPVLYMAGGVLDKEYYQKVMRVIKKEGVGHKTKVLGLVSHDKLLSLYKKAKAFIFPSTLEACPQALIEAMTYGLPMAISTASPMEEICQEAACYFDPYDISQIKESIGLILKNQNTRKELNRKALERSNYFCWNKNAKEMVRIFESTASK